MGFLKLAVLALLSLQTVSVVAKDEIDDDLGLDDDLTDSLVPELDVRVTTSFPQSEIFGVKLINGHPTQAVITVENNEDDSVFVEVVGGSLSNDQSNQVLRNLTSTPYNLEIVAGSKDSLTYSFATEMHPQDLRLQIITVLTKAKKGFYTVSAYNETVSIVEAPVSIFDPQIIFLYLFLGGLFGFTCWFIYNTWVTTLFPQKRGRGKTGDKTKRASTGTKRTEPSDQIAVGGVDGTAATSGAKTYDESWIPAQHLQRPEARRVGSGRASTPKTKARQA